MENQDEESAEHGRVPWAMWVRRIGVCLFIAGCVWILIAPFMFVGWGTKSPEGYFAGLFAYRAQLVLVCIATVLVLAGGVAGNRTIRALGTILAGLLAQFLCYAVAIYLPGWLAR